MAFRILKPASEISTHFRCHHCGILLNKVSWTQCCVCKAFNLCDECATNAYNTLSYVTRNDHVNFHSRKGHSTADVICMKTVSIMEADKNGHETRLEEEQMRYETIRNGKIKNDYDMAIVMDMLARDLPSDDSNVKSLVANYYLRARQRNINVLSLDGGGVRGYMPIKIIEALIEKQNHFKVEDLDLKNPNDKQFFLDKQKKFTENFDYFIGTSISGLIAFCLAVNYNILDMKKIFSDSKKYFKRNRFGPLFFSKYDPSVIHNQIDEIIDQIEFPGKTFVSRASEHATLLDLRNLLNPHNPIHEDKIKVAMAKRGKRLEFTDDISEGSDLRRVPREKILLIPSYNTTGKIATIFNTSYANDWGYRIADVLKATMATPTYFPPQKVYRGTQTGGCFTPKGNPELYVDGGVFANDPQVAALSAIRKQWKKPLNYNLLCVGTGCYTSTLSPSTWCGYYKWIFNGGFMVNTLMDVTRNLSEMIGNELAKFQNIKRMKLNYELNNKSMVLDDPQFVHLFDHEWETYLTDEDDFNAFVHFYENYILKK